MAHRRGHVRLLARWRVRVVHARRLREVDDRNIGDDWGGRSSEVRFALLQRVDGGGDEGARARRAVAGRVRRLLLDVADGDVRRQLVREAVHRVAARVALHERRDRRAAKARL